MILRPTPLLACIIVIAFAAATNGLKLQGQSDATQAASLRHEIQELKDETDILKAEWYRLNHPLRLQSLSEGNLNLITPRADQVFQGDEAGMKAALTSLALQTQATASLIRPPLPKPRRAPQPLPALDVILNGGDF